MSSPSSRLFFESRKYLPTQLAILFEPESEMFHIGSSYGSRREFIETVPKAQLADWLAEHCLQEERRHHDEMASAAFRARMSEELSLEHLTVVGNLDLGIDL
jgi:hypothetical protein